MNPDRLRQSVYHFSQKAGKVNTKKVVKTGFEFVYFVCFVREEEPQAARRGRGAAVTSWPVGPKAAGYRLQASGVGKKTEDGK